MLKAARLREAPAHAFVFLAFLGVALAASSRFADQFTSIKWYVLEALSLGWLLAELRHLRRWPIASPRANVALALLVTLVIAGSLRQGAAWAMEPLAARASFAFVALASLSYFRRTGSPLGPLRAAVAIAAVAIFVLGLLQLAGGHPLPWLTAGDQVSATFGNVNMAAQFLGLALVILVSGAPEAAEPGRSRAVLVLLFLFTGSVLAYLHVLGTRSVPLAVTGALFFLMLVEGRKALLGLAALGALGVAVLGSLPGAAGLPQSGGTSEHKRESVRVRLAVWTDTLHLIREHPLGVGAGNFEQAFIPYALGGRSRPGESLVFRSPHNEYLRLLAEEGFLASGALAALLVGLALALHRSPALGSWRSPPGRLLGSVAVFLVIEAFFQFPFEMAFPTLTAAVLLGLGGACLSSPEGPASTLWRLAALAAITAVGFALVRTLRAEALWVGGRNDVRAQEEACRLDPRRLEACVDAAWLRIQSGDHPSGRRTLGRVLEHAPHYFPAIKLLGEDALAQGDPVTGCRYLGLYDALFAGRSGLHERLRGECPTEAGESGLARPPEATGSSRP